MRAWIREFLLMRRVWNCWRRADHDYGQFLSNIGHEIARGKLPKDILDQ